MLAVDNLVAGYEPESPIVAGVSLVAEGGEIVSILGPNGAGKSTFIKSIAGLVPVASGRVRLAGRDITALPPHAMVQNGLAFVPQSDNVFATLSVAENLLLAAQRLPGAQRAARLAEMYTLFTDLGNAPTVLAGRLSGGQRQLLAVARALLAAPRVLLLDEPSAGLSPKAVIGLFRKLVEIRDTGVCIVLVEQNVRAALEIADRLYVLVDGRNRIDGTAAALRSDDRIAALYLGGGGAGRGGVGASHNATATTTATAP